MTERAQRFLFLGILFVYGACVLYHRRLVGPFVIDDTFIFLRYAEHLATGEGPVFNPGERVEGYTSFLWVVLLAAAQNLGLPILLFAKAAGAALGGLTLLACWRITRWLLPASPALALLAPAWLATNRTFTAWATQGMDVKLFGALVAWGLWLWLRALETPHRSWPWAGACLGLATLARPEGWLLAGVLGLGTLASSSARRAPAAWLREGVAFVAVVAPHLAFRVLYYGDLVPNTFHAKVVGLSIDQGWTWLRAALDANHVLPYAGLALLGVVALLRDPARRLGAASCLAVFVLFVAYLVGIGGDYFEFRFLDPILPLWALWTTAGVAALLPLLGERSRVGRFVVASACVLVLSLNVGTIASGFEHRPGISSIERECRYTEGYVAIGLWLRANLPAGESIALRPAGAIPYLSRASTLDLLGLNDREIAARQEFVVEGAVGHQRRVDEDYARERRITYWLGQPVLSARSLASEKRASVELARGLWFTFEPLQADVRFGPGSYPLGEHAGQAPRPF